MVVVGGNQKAAMDYTLEVKITQHSHDSERSLERDGVARRAQQAASK